MKLRNVFRLTTDSMIGRLGMCLLLMIVCFFAFFISNEIVTDYLGKSYFLRRAEKAYSHGADNTYGIDWTDKVHIRELLPYEDYKEFIEYLYDNDKISIKGLATRARIFYSEHYLDFVESFIIDKSLIELGNTGLDKNMLADGQIMLGSDFAFLGTERQLLVTMGMLDYEKAADGILNQDVLWPVEMDPTLVAMDEYINLNNKAVIIRDNQEEWYDGDYYNFRFVLDEGLTEQERESILNEIMDYAKQHKIPIKIINAGECLDEGWEELEFRYGKRLWAVVFVIIMAALSVLCATVIACLMRKKEFGIYYANGLGSGNISFMIAIENIIVTGIPFLAAMIIRYINVKGRVDAHSFEEYYMNMYFAEVVPVISVMCIVIICIGSIIPIVSTSKILPIELIKCED